MGRHSVKTLYTPPCFEWFFSHVFFNVAFLCFVLLLLLLFWYRFKVCFAKFLCFLFIYLFIFFVFYLFIYYFFWGYRDRRHAWSQHVHEACCTTGKGCACVLSGNEAAWLDCFKLSARLMLARRHHHRHHHHRHHHYTEQVGRTSDFKLNSTVCDFMMVIDCLLKVVRKRKVCFNFDELCECVLMKGKFIHGFNV